MQTDDKGSRVARALQSLQTNVQNAGPAVAASYALIGAILLLGSIGYAVDARYGTDPAFLVTGLLLGVGVGFYQLAKTLWRR